MIEREICFKCYRPQSSCMCKYISKIETKTKFVILMHPKEYRKTKNGTGHFTNLSLLNSEIIVGIDFSNNKRVNELIDNPDFNSYLLYPAEDSIELNTQSIDVNRKKSVIFILDSTWPCSKKMLRVSENLQKIPKISFKYTNKSNFKFKTQPNKFSLSTIESVFCVLQLLREQETEDIKVYELENFLKPFEKMVSYQLNCAKEKRIRNKIR